MIRSIITLVLAALLSGCVASVNKIAPDLALRQECKSILLMPMDIELSALTAGGILEPNAEWTAQASQYVEEALKGKFSERNITLFGKREVNGVRLNTEEEKLRTQLVKLHEVVGRSILVHRYAEGFGLPNKKGGFDWTLGEKAGFLKEKYGTDYALIVYLRDSYATAGRAVMIFAAAALGVGLPGGAQVGFASLVDLNTGQVVWFNRLVRGVGDMRNPASAKESVTVLLSDFPT